MAERRASVTPGFCAAHRPLPPVTRSRGRLRCRLSANVAEQRAASGHAKGGVVVPESKTGAAITQAWLADRVEPERCRALLGGPGSSLARPERDGSAAARA